MATKEMAHQYRLAQWAALTKERGELGMSIRSYCAMKDFAENTYFYWQRRLRDAADTHYDVVDNDNMMYMKFDLYEGEVSPQILIFRRPLEEHWWITGFRPGIGELPSHELVMVGSIKFPEHSMASEFATNVVSYASSRGAAKNSFTYTISDKTVTFTWG